MNKSDLIAGVARLRSVSQVQAAAWVDAVLQTLAEGMTSSTRVALHELGVFHRQHRASKAYRHPCTGQMDIMPEMTTITFSPSQPLRRRMRFEHTDERR